MANQLLHRAALGIAGTALLMMATAAEPAAAPHPGQAPAGFTSAEIRVNGNSVHYVRGGRGPVVILMHGFPEDWAAYQSIMPRLAQRFTVVAVDLPGLGRSAPPSSGYDAFNLAARIRGLAEALRLDRPYLVGHDLGGHVTYAYVRRFPELVRGAMILDVPIPGLPGSEQAGSGLWHVGFMQTPGLPEKLVPGRQDAFLGWFFDLGDFTQEERDYYVRAYGESQLRSAFEIYRAMPRTAELNATHTEQCAVPLLVAVGEKSPFGPALTSFVEGYRAHGLTSVASARIADAGHYVIADNPEAVAELIEQHAGNR